MLDARDFGLRRTLPVRAGRVPLRRINELQFIRGELWANLWGDQRLAVICPTSGAVQRFVDLSGLMSPAERRRLADPRCLLAAVNSLRSPFDLPPILPPTSLPPPSHLRLISVSSPRHPRAASSEHVLNGIAHDEQGDRLFVTGKCWPNIFQVSSA